jgi:hypothetical protein
MKTKRPKAEKGQNNQVRFVCTDLEKELLIELVEKIGTSQAEIFRQAIRYLADKNNIYENDSENFFIVG